MLKNKVTPLMRRALPQSSAGRPFWYLPSHWDTMVAYWDHDDTRFDTNHLEWQPVVSKSRRDTDTLEDIREVLTGRRR